MQESTSSTTSPATRPGSEPGARELSIDEAVAVAIALQQGDELDAAHEVDAAFDEHPPGVRVLALVEQLDPRLDRDPGPPVDQLRELLVGQPVEQREVTHVDQVHHVVAR